MHQSSGKRNQAVERETHSTGVRDDVADVLGGVLLPRRVRALGGEVGEARDLERERLAVDDVPVELVELQDMVSTRHFG